MPPDVLDVVTPPLVDTPEAGLDGAGATVAGAGAGEGWGATVGATYFGTAIEADTA